MKHLWLRIPAVALVTGTAQAQIPTPATKVYTYVEEMPQPPGGGGNAAIVALIQKGVRILLFHGNYPERSRVMVEFTVTADGAVRNVHIIQSLDSRVDSAVVHAVRALPRFRPGRQRGAAVSVKYTVPITFCWQ